MATIAGRFFQSEPRPDVLSGTPRAHAIDRWIFVIMAGWFIVIVLAGFIPDSIMKIGLVRAGERPPFPLVMHMHAVVMGSFLLLLLTQTVLMATGRHEYHMQLGVAAFVLAPALIIVGSILAPTMYHETWNALQTAPPYAQAKLRADLLRKDNILLLQIRIAFLFPLFIVVGLAARRHAAGLHKRMMILAVAPALGAAIDRMHWLPTTLPGSPLSSDLYIVAAVLPMLVWDVVRNERVHRAYWIWFGLYIPVALLSYGLWNTPWWHATSQQIMGAS